MLNENNFDYNGTYYYKKQTSYIKKLAGCGLFCSLLSIIIFTGISLWFSHRINNIMSTETKNGVQLLTYRSAGDYVVTPADYHFSDNLIIEAWSAGGSGGVNVFETYTQFCGGGSGGYVKINIKTYQQNFIVRVGHGGEGLLEYNGTPASIKCNGTSGQLTQFISNKFNLTISGGSSGCFPTGNGTGGSVTISNNQTSGLIVPGNSGTLLKTGGWGVAISGGSAPFGGEGGSNDLFDWMSHSGEFPGGGGNSFWPQGTVSKYNLSKGGDGLLNIYFSL